MYMCMYMYSCMCTCVYPVILYICTCEYHSCMCVCIRKSEHNLFTCSQTLVECMYIGIPIQKIISNVINLCVIVWALHTACADYVTHHSNVIHSLVQ